MNLLEQAVEDYVQGVLEVVREEDGVRLLRMTPAQLAYYDQSEGWGIRARCNAGVSLGFRTNSSFLDVKLAVLSGARRYFGMDVEIDGVISHAVRLDDAAGVFETRLFEVEERREREVRVYFSPNLEVKVLSVALEADAAVAPLDRPSYRLLCLGDSITQGMDARSACSTYPVQLARMLGAELLNQGVGGHIFDPDSLDPALSFAPDLVTVAYGTNDWGRNTTQAEIRGTVRDYLGKLRTMFPADRTRVAVLSPIWRETGHEQKGGGILADFSRAILEATLEAEDVIAIDGSALVPNQSWYLEDGTHPNDLGFLHYGLNLYRLLRDGLK